MGKYFVTGASGTIGRCVVRELLSEGHEVVAAVRSPDRFQIYRDNHRLEVTAFDFEDSKTFAGKLRNIEGVFLVRPPELATPEKDMLPFLMAVKEAKVPMTVFISLLGVENNPFVPHRKIENYIQNLGISHCFLRPSFFMQNLTGVHLEEIRDRNELFIPAGYSKTSFVDTEDIAKAAVRVLTEPKDKALHYTLTGPEALDYYEVANQLSEGLGRPIVYRKPSLWSFRKRLIQFGTPKAFANVMTMLYWMTQLGTAKTITHDLEKLLGTAPTTFMRFVEREKAQFIQKSMD